MKALIDTNVILDALIGREPFLKMSEYVINLCGERIIKGFIAAHSVTNLFYLLRKHYSADCCRTILLSILDLLDVVKVDKASLTASLKNKDFKDFEDCLQMECGHEAEVSYIVTRNKKDFVNSYIPCLTPDEVYEMFPPEEI